MTQAYTEISIEDAYGPTDMMPMQALIRGSNVSKMSGRAFSSEPMTLMLLMIMYRVAGGKPL